MDPMCNYLPGDPRLVEQIVKELKSQGIFDQFRKECISDVDTKPAYQNLRQRVEGSVSNFLQGQTWSANMNKNQIREMLRKHINESGFLEIGVERIVDQVVNPKINSVFIPKVDDVMYKFLGIDRPKVNKSGSLEINTVLDLLPKDLEAISPEIPDEIELDKEVIEEVHILGMSSITDNGEKIIQEENSIDSQSSVLSGIASQDSNNSMRQDSVMSLNSSESRMSPSINNTKMEQEDITSCQKSSELIVKSETLDVKMNAAIIENNIETDNPDACQERSSDEIKTRTKDKKRERHHSSSDRSKSKHDKEKEKSKSDKSRNDDKDGKNTEDKKYKIPKLSDKIKENKTKEKEDKSRSDKERNEKEKRSDKDRKYDKDKKSRHSSDKSSSTNEKSSRKDKSEKRDKDDKKERKDSSKNDRSRDDKKSSSLKKRESNHSKDSSSHKEKEKESHSRVSKEDKSEKSKSEHSSSNSKKDFKRKKDEDKSNSNYKKDEKKDKDDRKRKRRSKDDHHSSKEKRSGDRSSDRDSDGPSSSKRSHVSSENNGNSTQGSSQDSVALNTESSSGYSGNSENVEEKYEDCSNISKLDMQKIKVPKFASNLNEAMKIMKIRKLIKKLDALIKINPQNAEIQNIMRDIEKISENLNREKKLNEQNAEDKEQTTEINQPIEETKTAPLDINEFISSSTISMAKWNALEAKFMEQITDVDYNSYESPYEDQDGNSITKDKCSADSEHEELTSMPRNFEIKSLNVDHTSTNSEQTEEKHVNLCGSKEIIEYNDIHEEKQQLKGCSADQSSSYHSDITVDPLQPTDMESTNFHSVDKTTSNFENTNICVEVEDVKSNNFKDFKQRAVVLLHKHDLTEKMIKTKKSENVPVIETNNSCYIKDNGKENIEVNTNYQVDTPIDKIEVLKKTDADFVKQKTLSNEHTENNVTLEECNSQHMEIYSLQNSCEVCSDSQGDTFKGFDQSKNLRPLNIIKSIINILETEISSFKEANMEYLNKKQNNFDHTRKKKVIGKKTDAINNNSASKHLEVDNIELRSENLLLSTEKVCFRSSSETRIELDHATKNEHQTERKAINNKHCLETREHSGVGLNTPVKANQVDTSLNKSSDTSSGKKNRNNQRYSSEDLYKPRMCLRRSGRDPKNS